MICKRCGKEFTPDELSACPFCGEAVDGAQRAALRYREQMHAARGASPVQLSDRSTLSRAGQAARARHRRPSSQRPTAEPQTAARPRPSRSMPPKAPIAPPPDAPETPVRMVRRHQTEAIIPEQTDSFNWLRLCGITALCVLILVVGLYFFLTRSLSGQMYLASLGRETTAEAYHQLGRNYMESGSISRAVRALEVAQGKEPDDLEILVDLGKAYLGDDQTDMAELAFTRAIQFWPAYPEPYRSIIDIMLGDGRKYEALQLTELAYEQTEDDYFNILLKEMIPATPGVTVLGGRYASPFTLELTCREGGVIYYSILGEDPLDERQQYDPNEKVFLDEGTWKLRAVTFYDGMYSKETLQTYIINKPSPDMPKATLPTNTYSSVRTVSLRAGADVVAIHYTVDGTAPTTRSAIFKEPITLRVGKTVLRAIAVNADGKISNELNIEYVCEGKVKSSMAEKDTVGKLALYGTTQSAFIRDYGEPRETLPDGKDEVGTYTRLVYGFGYAVFVDRDNGKEPVLAELVCKDGTFTAPRSTSVGMSRDDVLSAFRDNGGEADIDGNRVLYSILSGDAGGNIGLLKRLDETHEHIGYYCKASKESYIELSFYLTEGVVTRFEWLRYSIAK